MKLSFALGADPRTGKLAPAGAPYWHGLRATFRDVAGTTIYQTPLATGAGRWMEMPARR